MSSAPCDPQTLRVCFVAAPLIARSGVYNSTLELVAEARSRGLPWTAELGVSAAAPGLALDETLTGVREFSCEPAGVGGVRLLTARYRSSDLVMGADLVISMNPQSDMALARAGVPWIAYLRGLPWPAPGESARVKRAVWSLMERLALRRAQEIWATTEVLVKETRLAVDRLVPPGLHFERGCEEQPGGKTFVWAARYSQDKGPDLMLEAMRGSKVTATMFGSGPLRDDLARRAPDNVRVAGWAAKDELWRDARAYVGTSTREAFGRSAVEAALRGIPSVLSNTFGAAPLLYRDPELRDLLVLPREDASLWRSTMERLATDDVLHRRAASHVMESAGLLTIDRAVTHVLASAREAHRNSRAAAARVRHREEGSQR